MEKETSCVNSRAILDYLKQHDVDCSSLFGDLDPEIDILEDPEKFLRDPNNWISCSVISKLYKRAKLILHDEKAAYKIGRYASENISLGYAQRIVFKSFWSVRKTLKNAQKINDQWNRNKKVELIELKQNEAIVRLHWHSEMEVTKDICLYNQGAYTSLPLVWGGSPATLKEKCCYFNGAPYCEYHLKWPFKNKFYETFSRFFTSKSVLMDTIKEMEIDKKIIEKKTEKLKNEMEERKQAEEALRESEEKYRISIEMASDAIISGTEKFIEFNKKALELFGASTPDEIKGKAPFDLSPPTQPDGSDSKEKAKKIIAKVYAGEPQFFYWKHKQIDGTLIDTEVNLSLMEVKGGPWIFGIIRDITNRKRMEEELRKSHNELEIRVTERTADLAKANKQLKQEIEDRKLAEEQISESLREKEVLLSEVHHRVKNNFEIISSLLDLGSMNTKNQEVQNLWKDARSRIHSMALIHSQLYENDRFDNIDMERHVHKLVNHLYQVYEGNGGRITTTIKPSEIYLSVSQAIPCALVLNELITNAFKHAFKDREEGTIHISIKNPIGDTVQISVKDDGSGISEDVDLSNATGLGLKLIRHLVIGQLKGEMRFNIDNGTEFQIDFKKVE